MTYALIWQAYFVFLYYFMTSSILNTFVKPYTDDECTVNK